METLKPVASFHVALWVEAGETGLNRKQGVKLETLLS